MPHDGDSDSGGEADSSIIDAEQVTPQLAHTNSSAQQQQQQQPTQQNEQTASANATAASASSSTAESASASSAVGPSPPPVPAVPSSSSASPAVSAVESSLVMLASSAAQAAPHSPPKVKFQPRPLPKPGSAQPRPLLTRAGTTGSRTGPRPVALISSSSPKLLSSLYGFSYHHYDPGSARTISRSRGRGGSGGSGGSKPPSPDLGRLQQKKLSRHRKSGSDELWAANKVERERRRREAEMAHAAALDTPPAPAAAAAVAPVASATLLPPSQLTHSDLTRPPENRHRRGISTELRVPMDPRHRGSGSSVGARQLTERAAKPNGTTPPPPSDAARAALSPSFLLGTPPQHPRTPQPSASQVSADSAPVSTTSTAAPMGQKEKAMLLSRNAALAKAAAAAGAGSGNPKDTSPRPLEMLPRPVSTTRIQLRYLFFGFTLLQVALCCGIVWFLGYRNSLETVRVLSSQIRRAQLIDVANDIARYADQVLVSADQVASSMTLKLPELASLGGLDPAAAANVSVLHKPGLLGLMSYQLSSFNQIPMYGVSCANGIFLSARHTSVPDRHTYQIHDPALSALRNASAENTVYEFAFNRRAWYSNTSGRIDPFNDDRVRTHASYFQALPDFTGTQTSQELLQMLGEPFETVERFNNTQRPLYQQALQMGEARLAWSPTFALQFEPAGKIAIAAIKPVMDTLGDPASGRPPSGNLSFVAFAAFYLDYLRESILDPLVSNLGEHGCIFVVESGGRLVASTRGGFQILDQNHPQVNLLQSSDEFVSDMMGAVTESPLLGLDRDQRANSLLWAQEDWVAATIEARDGGNAPSPDLVWPLPTAASRHTYSSSDRVAQSLLPGITFGDRAFRSVRTDWHLSAKSLNIPGLDWVVIVCTRDSDFDGGLAENLLLTVWFTLLVAVVAVAISLLLAHCISRPLAKLVAFMEIVAVKMQGRAAEHTAGGVVGAAHEAATNAELSEMCRQWKSTMDSLHGSSGSRRGASKTSSSLGSGSGADSESGCSDSDEDASGAIRMNRLARRRSTSLMQRDNADKALDNAAAALAAGTSRRRVKPSKGLCARMRTAFKRHLPACVRQFPMRETQLLQSSFGTMLESLHTNHVQLQTANESKRRFIRYIFHEVRVPFNAIVLGVEQLREDLYTEPLRPTEEMQDVVNILNEQSKVVARILNDVLSLQKIEDGALALDMAPFNFLEMACGTLRSFQPLFVEKRLSLVTELQSLEEALASHARQAWNERYGENAADALVAAPSAAANTAQSTAATVAAAFRHVPGFESDSGPSTNESSPAVAIRPLTFGKSSHPEMRPSSIKEASVSTSHSIGSELAQQASAYAHDVLGDRYRLRQVLANFLSNAVKFSNANGKIHVSITCTPVESAAEKARRKQVESEHERHLEAQVQAKLAAADAALAHVIDVAAEHKEGAAHKTAESSAAATLTVPDAGIPLFAGGSTFAWRPPSQVLVRVSVRDSGRGISLAEQQSLFQPYVQLSSGGGEHHESKGTGLGLNISKSLVMLHGGVIGVSSAGVAGKGSEFFFELVMDVVESTKRSATASPQVFHVSNPKGPASMRAWHPQSTSKMSEGTPQTRSSPIRHTPANMFSLQGMPHTNAPLTASMRNRTLMERERRDTATPLVNESSFSPLVGSSRRVMTTRNPSLGLGISAAAPTLPSVAATAAATPGGSPLTPGTSNASAIHNPNAHLSKLALLHGLANESSGYGFGYSSRGNAIASVPQSQGGLLSPSDTDGSDNVLPSPSGDTDAMAPVLTPMEDSDSEQNPPGDMTELREADIALVPFAAGANTAGPPVIQGSLGIVARAPVLYVPSSNPPVLYVPSASESKASEPERIEISYSSSSSSSSRSNSISETQTSTYTATASSQAISGAGAQPRPRRASGPEVHDALAAIFSNVMSQQVPAAAARPMPPTHRPPVQPPPRPQSAEVSLNQASRSSQSHEVVGSAAMSSDPPASHAPQASSARSSPKQHRFTLSVLPPTPPNEQQQQQQQVVRMHVGAAPAPSGDVSVRRTPPMPLSRIIVPDGIAAAAPVPSAIAPVVAASSASSSLSSSSSHDVPSPLFRPRILVVEDSAPNRKLLVMLLSALKCDVVGVENGLLAVQEFASWATEKWVGDNVAGRMEGAESKATEGGWAPAGTAAASSSSSSSSHIQTLESGVKSPSDDLAAAALVAMGSTPTGTHMDDAGAPSGAADSAAPAASAAVSAASSASPPPPVRHLRCPYDLVFIDGNMPVMNGIQTTRNLRALGFTHLPMIAVTGNAESSDLEEFKRAGIDKILTKPVQRAGLQATLKEYLPNFQITTTAAQIKMRNAK